MYKPLPAANCRTLVVSASSALAALVTLPAQSVWAADAADESEVNAHAQLDEVIVSARRREERLQEVPVAVTAFGEEELRERSVMQTDDLRYVVPGLTITGQLSKDSPTLVIRGQRRALGGDAAPSVITYFADIPLPNDGAIVPTYDVKSMQVLKGPQGTLFGRNTTGGALLMYPNEPSYDFGGYVKTTAGNFNELNFEGAVNIPVLDNRLAVRLAGQIARRDGYTENLGVGPDLDDRQANALRVSVLWDIADGLKNSTVFDHLRADEAGSAAVFSGTYPIPGVISGAGARSAVNAPFFDCNTATACDVDLLLQAQRAAGIRTVNTDVAPYSNRTIYGVANTTIWEAGPLTVKNIFGLRSNFIDALNDMDGAPLPMIHLRRLIDSRQISDELQLFGDAFNERLEYIVGAFYLDLSPDGIQGTATRTFVRPGLATRLVQDYRTTKSKALFGQVGVELGAGFSVDAGYRYTWDEGATCTVSVLETGAPVGEENCAAAGGTSGGVDSAAPTWTVGVNYQITDDWMVYLTSRRGYRSAGFNTPQFAPVFAAYQNFGPEELTDVELGLKSDWNIGDWRGRTNLAVFHGKYEGIQRSITLAANTDGDGNPANDPTTMILNAAEATIKGAELEFTIMPTDRLNITLTGSYTDAGFDKFEAPTIFVPLLGVNPVLNKFSYTPEWTLGANLRYGVPVGSAGELAFNLNYFLSDKVWYVERPLDVNGIQPSFGVMNGRLDWNDVGGASLDASIYVRNVLDKEYAGGGGYVTPSVTPTSLIMGEPRMYGVEVRYRFGK